MYPGGGSVLATSAWGDLSYDNTFAKVLKVLSMLRRQGTPMRAHLQLPDTTTTTTTTTTNDHNNNNDDNDSSTNNSDINNTVTSISIIHTDSGINDNNHK